VNAGQIAALIMGGLICSASTFLLLFAIFGRRKP
jgi:hypothetical protein